MTNDAHAKSLLERIMQEPFKRAPARMHFDGALNPPIVGIFQIGVATSDVRDNSAVLSVEYFEQVVRGVDCFRRGFSFDQDVRRAADWLALAPIEDVAIAAHAGIT